MLLSPVFTVSDVVAVEVLFVVASCVAVDAEVPVDAVVAAAVVVSVVVSVDVDIADSVCSWVEVSSDVPDGSSVGTGAGIAPSSSSPESRDKA